jgi:hypothetical protein
VGGNANICMISQIESQECCFCVCVAMPPRPAISCPASRDVTFLFRILHCFGKTYKKWYRFSDLWAYLITCAVYFKVIKFSANVRKCV